MSASTRYDEAVSYLALASQSIAGASSNLYEFARAMQDGIDEDPEYEPTDEQMQRTGEALTSLGSSLDVLEQVTLWLDRQLEDPETSTEQSPLLSEESDFIPN